MLEKEQFDRANLPKQFRPLSAWDYWGLGILFAIPVVGLVFLIVYSCDHSNVNRRSFARSYFCSLVLVIILVVILAATGLLAYIGSEADLTSLLNL